MTCKPIRLKYVAKESCGGCVFYFLSRACCPVNADSCRFSEILTALVKQTERVSSEGKVREEMLDKTGLVICYNLQTEAAFSLGP